jgi:hypothetical protein
MYSSLTKVDIIATDPKTGLAQYVLTDHREVDEAEATPEISTLFALARVLAAQQYARKHNATAEVVYVAMGGCSPSVECALAVVGVTLETPPEPQQRVIAKSGEDVGMLIDATLAALAKRVALRCGLSEYSLVLRSLEAEIVVQPPDQQNDEIEYWTRAMELIAVTGEVLRRNIGGTWVEFDDCVLPFAFAIAKQGMALLPNRAVRFLADGADESMFLLINAQDELGSSDDAPIFPSLRARADAVHENSLWVPLIEGSGNDKLPVVVFGSNRSQTFGIKKSDAAEDVEALRVEALRNIAAHEVTIDMLEIGDDRLLQVSGSFFATEKILDRVFMRTIHQRLSAEILVVTVPRRGLMLCIGRATDVRAIKLLELATQDACKGSRSISDQKLMVRDGELVGTVEFSTEKSTADEPKTSARKPGFLGRIFGKKR